jgi:hypothetical protein
MLLLDNGLGGTMRSRRIRIALAAAFALALGVASFAFAAGRDHGGHDGHHNGKQSLGSVLLGGYETPKSIHTAGHGTLSLTINDTNPVTLSYTLTYSNLTSVATMAHIHFGQMATSGGVAVWLCGGGGKPACPAGNTSTAATVSGTISAADVLPLSDQNLAAGDLAGLISEIKAGFTYANVHSTNYGSGEIRGQIGRGDGHHGDDEDDDD